jgi:hypothetical protein
MKKHTLIILLFVLSWQATAQTTEVSDFKRHEAKLNVHYLLGGSLNLLYEYHLNDWSSIGAVGSYTFFNSWMSPRATAEAFGTYRLYFGSRPLSKFFFEGNLGMVSWVTHTPAPDDISTGFGAGLTFGWKFVTQNNFVLDIFVGMTRASASYTAQDHSGTYTVNNGMLYGRFGICVGKRF